jgi:hypothetical protein
MYICLVCVIDAILFALIYCYCIAVVDLKDVWSRSKLISDIGILYCSSIGST